MADEANNGAPKSSIMTKAKAGGDKLAGWALLAPGEAVQAASRMSGRTLAWIGIALAGVILLSANIISSAIFKNATADLTASGLYTISDGTKRVLAKIEEPIDVKVYFSDRLGELSALHKRYFERVRGLFERYENLTGGLLKVRFVDPKPFSDAEDRAVLQASTVCGSAPAVTMATSAWLQPTPRTIAKSCRSLRRSARLSSNTT